MNNRVTALRWDTKEPCASCPYRKDAKLGFWDPRHFLDTLMGSADPLRGPIFACHGTRKLPEGPAICAGWLLDQMKNGCPSIQLRLACVRDPAAAQATYEVHDGGHELYESIEEMCIANGVFPRRGHGEGTEIPGRARTRDARARGTGDVQDEAGDRRTRKRVDSSEGKTRDQRKRKVRRAPARRKKPTPRRR